MRPVERGACPQRAGVDIRFSDYKQARPELIARLGSYCSYCEMKLDASLAVEHVKPKSLNNSLALTWDNFLLACTNCNSTKQDRPVSLGC